MGNGKSEALYFGAEVGVDSILALSDTLGDLQRDGKAIRTENFSGYFKPLECIQVLFCWSPGSTFNIQPTLSSLTPTDTLVHGAHVTSSHFKHSLRFNFKSFRLKSGSCCPDGQSRSHWKWRLFGKCVRGTPSLEFTSSLCGSERAYHRWPIIHHSDSNFATWVPKQRHGNSSCLLPGDCEYTMSWGRRLEPTEERYRSEKARCAHSHTGEGGRSDVQTGGMWRSENSNVAAENRLRARADAHTRAPTPALELTER